MTLKEAKDEIAALKEQLANEQERNGMLKSRNAALEAERDTAVRHVDEIQDIKLKLQKLGKSLQ